MKEELVELLELQKENSEFLAEMKRAISCKDKESYYFYEALLMINLERMKELVK